MNGEENKNFKIFIEEKLKEKGIDLKRLSEISGISLSYLNNLINENLVDLPAAPYVRGYLTKLGKILNFNSESWWEYFKNKKDLKTSGAEDELPKNRFAKEAIFKYFLIAFIGVIILIYLILRFNVIFGKPVIELNLSPQVLTTNENKFILSGRVQNGDKVFINSEEAVLNENKEFSKEIMLQPGLNNIEIKVQKLLGQETKILRQIFYEKKQPELQNLPTSTSTSTSTNNF
ncbi:MAG: helix-turn-helix domain-containing protein [Minisyncoccia bacterium]